MSRPIERLLFAVILAGLAALAMMLWNPARRSISGPPAAVSSSSDHPEAASIRTSIGAPAFPADLSEAAAVAVAAADSAAWSTTAGGLTRVPDADWVPASSASPASTAAEPSGGTAPPSASTAVPAAGSSDGEETVPPRCAPVEELWEADGLPVEDPCTIEEVRRVFRWAWTGTYGQRRAAIRNGHLLDDVFQALDGYGRTHDASLFHPEERRRYSILFDDIRWQGGPAHDRAVIGVLYRFAHPDAETGDQLLDTLVQIDGEWKLSYRRSYCVKVLVIMEYIGSSVRCPRDPQPEINEDEAPGSTGQRYW